MVSYLFVSAVDGLAGLSEGGGTPPAFLEMDLSAMGDCSAEPVVPWPEDSLGITDCTDDGDCEEEAKCVLGVCYAPKHRYISIAANPSQVPNTARLVKLQSGTLLGWVGAPYENDGLTLADVVPSPVYAGISFAGEWPDVVHVTGCEIATNQTYVVQAFQTGRDIGNEGNYAGALVLHTPSAWGDTVSIWTGGVFLPPDGIVGLADVMVAVEAFQGNMLVPITWLDIAPSTGSSDPDQVVGLGDIMGAVGGFQGSLYPGDGPLDCP